MTLLYYFPHKLLLTNMQPSKIRKTFGNGLSANVKFSKLELSKMIQVGEFLKVAVATAVFPATAFDYLKYAESGKKVLKALLDAGYGLINKNPSLLLRGPGLNLTKNEIGDIAKVTRSLENRRIFLKGTTRKITGRNGELS